MSRTKRFYRACLCAGGALFLLQTGPCVANSTVQSEAVWAQIASVVSDFVFFVLDNAFVRLSVS